MRIISLTIFSLWIFCPVHGQEIPCSDLSKYKAAYEYIISDSVMRCEDLYVSSSVNAMSWSISYVYSKACPERNNVVDDYLAEDIFPSYHSKELDKLINRRNPKAKNILFFFRIIENTLRADLFLNRFSLKQFEYSKTYSEMAYTYLFAFQADGTIKHAFREGMVYDIVVCVEDDTIMQVPPLSIPATSLEKLPAIRLSPSQVTVKKR